MNLALLAKWRWWYLLGEGGLWNHIRNAWYGVCHPSPHLIADNLKRSISPLGPPLISKSLLTLVSRGTIRLRATTLALVPPSTHHFIVSLCILLIYPTAAYQLREIPSLLITNGPLDISSQAIFELDTFGELSSLRIIVRVELSKFHKLRSIFCNRHITLFQFQKLNFLLGSDILRKVPTQKFSSEHGPGHNRTILL